MRRIASVLRQSIGKLRAESDRPPRILQGPVYNRSFAQTLLPILSDRLLCDAVRAIHVVEPCFFEVRKPGSLDMGHPWQVRQLVRIEEITPAVIALGPELAEWNR